jgi:hypothetical protein
MPITINGTGSIEGISAGGLPDASITASELASGAINTQALALFNASGSAPVYACRAWVNFNGTGTVAIRASGNVTSITDNGVGDYTVNFTNAMPDTNFVVSWTAGEIAAQFAVGTNTSVRVYNYKRLDVYTLEDSVVCNFAAFR